MTRPPELPPEPPLPELSSLPREIEPPPPLEDRVVSAMRDASLIRRRAGLVWWQLAAAAALFTAGVAAGRLSTPGGTPPTVQPRFLLLLLAGPATGLENARVAEYRAWAIAQREAGRQITGERLASGGVLVDRAGTDAPVHDDLQGFFIVSGAGLDDVANVARTSPHVRAGGRVIVRPIDTP